MKQSIAEYIVLTVLMFVVLCLMLFVVLYIMYPIRYRDFVCKYSDEFNVDSLLVFSVMKSESGFEKDAVSSKNAVGLMQITPNTGKWIADNMDISEYSLSNPETNIMFSCWYLDYLYGRFGDMKTVVAAYNAGEGNVKNWLNNPKYSSDGKTITDIPYGETDKYVKKVMNTYSIYNKLY